MVNNLDMQDKDSIKNDVCSQKETQSEGFRGLKRTEAAPANQRQLARANHGFQLI